MKYINLILKNDGRIHILTINRPLMKNALSQDVLKELDQVISSLDKNSKIKVLLITGTDNSFIAGADIKEFYEMDIDRAIKYAEFGKNVFQKIYNLKFPVIAVINGYALGGGCELALCCDFRIASEKAQFGFPEINIGLIPGFGGTQRLPYLIGLSKAKELIFTGKLINANEALNLGLVNKVIQHDKLLDESIKIAEEFVLKSKIILGYCKEAFSNIYFENIYEGLNRESNLFGGCFSTEDHKEGINAFSEKRKPNFNDK